MMKWLQRQSSFRKLTKKNDSSKEAKQPTECDGKKTLFRLSLKNKFKKSNQSKKNDPLANSFPSVSISEKLPERKEESIPNVTNKSDKCDRVPLYDNLVFSASSISGESSSMGSYVLKSEVEDGKYSRQSRHSTFAGSESSFDDFILPENTKGTAEDVYPKDFIKECFVENDHIVDKHPLHSLTSYDSSFTDNSYTVSNLQNIIKSDKQALYSKARMASTEDLCEKLSGEKQFDIVENFDREAEKEVETVLVPAQISEAQRTNIMTTVDAPLNFKEEYNTECHVRDTQEEDSLSDVLEALEERFENNLSDSVSLKSEERELDIESKISDPIYVDESKGERDVKSEFEISSLVDELRKPKEEKEETKISGPRDFTNSEGGRDVDSEANVVRPVGIVLCESEEEKDSEPKQHFDPLGITKSEEEEGVVFKAPRSVNFEKSEKKNDVNSQFIISGLNDTDSEIRAKETELNDVLQNIDGLSNSPNSRSSSSSPTLSFEDCKENSLEQDFTRSVNWNKIFFFNKIEEEEEQFNATPKAVKSLSDDSLSTDIGSVCSVINLNDCSDFGQSESCPEHQTDASEAKASITPKGETAEFNSTVENDYSKVNPNESDQCMSSNQDDEIVERKLIGPIEITITHPTPLKKPITRKNKPIHYPEELNPFDEEHPNADQLDKVEKHRNEIVYLTNQNGRNVNSNSYNKLDSITDSKAKPEAIAEIPTNKIQNGGFKNVPPNPFDESDCDEHEPSTTPPNPFDEEEDDDEGSPSPPLRNCIDVPPPPPPHLPPKSNNFIRRKNSRGELAPLPRPRRSKQSLHGSYTSLQNVSLFPVPVPRSLVTPSGSTTALNESTSTTTNPFDDDDQVEETDKVRPNALQRCSFRMGASTSALAPMSRSGVRSSLPLSSKYRRKNRPAPLPPGHVSRKPPSERCLEPNTNYNSRSRRSLSPTRNRSHSHNVSSSSSSSFDRYFLGAEKESVFARQPPPRPPPPKV